VAEAEGSPPDAELAVVVCSDEEIRSLNQRFLAKDAATNVLSFGAADPDDPRLPGVPLQLGDVVISLDTAEREAEEAGIDPGERVKRLAVHGILHLFGHDHESHTDAKRMQALEDGYLAP
jgi:probable rRNA maturation factor